MRKARMRIIGAWVGFVLTLALLLDFTSARDVCGMVGFSDRSHYVQCVRAEMLAPWEDR